jgi:hypothetical protein
MLFYTGLSEQMNILGGLWLRRESITKKDVKNGWNGFVWIRIGISGGLL